MKLKIRNKKHWYVINSEWKGYYSHENEIKFLTNSLESTGNNRGVDANTKVTFKNCARFRKCRTEINETFVNNGEHVNIAMTMYNLIEYSNNYCDTSGNLWKFKRDEIEEDADLTLDDNHIPNNSSSFKYK